jgi:hypothetical protein
MSPTLKAETSRITARHQDRTGQISEQQCPKNVPTIEPAAIHMRRLCARPALAAFHELVHQLLHHGRYD